MNRQPEMIGRRFGRLVVKGIHEKKKKYTKFRCLCDCGQEKVVIGYNLRNDHTKSCGCLRKEVATTTNTTHGLSKSRFYQCWRDMNDRTSRLDNESYENYGGRGISVCDEWKQFEGFMKDMHESYLEHSREHGELDTTLDRIDTNGDYSLANCRWATNKVQSSNRRSNKKQMVDGVIMTAKEISEKYGISYSAIIHRINRGWIGNDLKLPIGGVRDKTQS